jgi:hypothetical protein
MVTDLQPLRLPLIAEERLSLLLDEKDSFIVDFFNIL